MRLLGRVYAPDRKAAEAAAVEQFKLNAEERKRLVLQDLQVGRTISTRKVD